MPISRGEFQQRRIDLTVPILDLLSGRSDLAFTVEDIQQVLLETSWRRAVLEEVQQALATLVSSGRVEVAEFEGHRWYTVVERVQRRLGFLREQV